MEVEKIAWPSFKDLPTWPGIDEIPTWPGIDEQTNNLIMDKTVVEVRATNIKSSKTFENEIRKLINGELTAENREEAHSIALTEVGVKKIGTTYYKIITIVVNGKAINLEEIATEEEYNYRNHTETTKTDYNNYLRAITLELIEREVVDLFNNITL